MYGKANAYAVSHTPQDQGCTKATPREQPLEVSRSIAYGQAQSRAGSANDSADDTGARFHGHNTNAHVHVHVDEHTADGHEHTAAVDEHAAADAHKGHDIYGRPHQYDLIPISLGDLFFT